MIELIQYIVAQHSPEVAQLFSVHGVKTPVTPESLLNFLEQHPKADADLAKIIAQENGFDSFTSTDDFWGFFINMFKNKRNKPRKVNQSNGVHRRQQPQPRNAYQGAEEADYQEFDGFDYAKGKKQPTTYTTALPSFDIGARRRSSADLQATRKSLDQSKLESEKVANDTAKAISETNAKATADGAGNATPSPSAPKKDFKAYIPYIIAACAIIGLGITLYKIFKK